MVQQSLLVTVGEIVCEEHRQERLQKQGRYKHCLEASVSSNSGKSLGYGMLEFILKTDNKGV